MCTPNMVMGFESIIYMLTSQSRKEEEGLLSTTDTISQMAASRASKANILTIVIDDSGVPVKKKI